MAAERVPSRAVAEFAALQKADHDRFGNLIKDANIKLE
jgi:hypothetical protein